MTASILIGCLAASISVGLDAPPAAGQPTEAWPALQGGAGHLGAAPVSLAPPLRASWRVKPGGDGRLSTPVLSSDLAVSTGRTAVIGFDPASGELLWSDVERAEGLVVAPAVDPRTGTLLYLEGDGPNDSSLVALDPADRTRLWGFPLGSQSRTAPNVDDGVVFVGTRDRTVLAVEVESGTETWRAQVESEVTTSPAVAGDRVFVVTEDSTSGRSRLYALDAADGRVAWTYSPSGISVGVSSATVVNGSVYVGFGDANIRAFDAASGSLRWTQPVRVPFSSLSTLAFADGSLFAIDAGGGVYRLDAITGEMNWDYQFPSLATWGAPVAVGDAVYVGLDDGTIAAISVDSGHVVWRTRLRQGAIGAFSPLEGRLLAPVIGARGGVVAFEEAPERALVDLPSPSDLDLPRALLNFLAATAVVLAFVLLLFRLTLPRLQAARARGREQ